MRKKQKNVTEEQTPKTMRKAKKGGSGYEKEE